MVLPPQDIINQKLCSEYYISGPSPSFEVHIAMGASICQVIGSTMGDQQPKSTPDLQLCLNGSMPQIKVNTHTHRWRPLLVGQRCWLLN